MSNKLNGPKRNVMWGISHERRGSRKTEKQGKAAAETGIEADVPN
jgi:hypothetical protein